MGRRSSGSTGKNTALFIGESRELIDLCEWARQRNLVPVEIPHQGLLCAVADEDVLDGLCTPGEASILQRAHAMGIPCLTPAEARRFLASTLARQPTWRGAPSSADSGAERPSPPTVQPPRRWSC